MSITAAPPAERPPAAAPEVPAAQAIPAAPTAASDMLCDNCGKAVQSHYCSSCGQRVEPPVHSLWHFMTVTAEDLTHADSRLWRTLAALLFKPGYLTREFLHGRRASYLPPVRLYLVLSVVFFLWASTSQPKLDLLRFDSSTPDPTAASNPGRHARPAPAPPADEGAAQRAERLCRGEGYGGPFVTQLARACRQVVQDNGRSLQEAFLHNLPRAMFVFLPLLAGVMMLMYWRPRHYYVEHLLLFVHDHAFVFLGVMLAWALARLVPFAAGWVRFALVLYIPWYVYRSMRVVYGQGRLLTGAKLVLLSLFYLAGGMLMLALNVMYSALTL